MTVIRRSHAYRDGSMVAECGYPRRPREPMDARKPTCPVCLKIERQRSQLEGAVNALVAIWRDTADKSRPPAIRAAKALRTMGVDPSTHRGQYCPNLADERSFMCEDHAGEADTELDGLAEQLRGAVAENEKLRLQVAALENDGIELAARLGEAEEQIAHLISAANPAGDAVGSGERVDALTVSPDDWPREWRATV